MQNFSFVLGIRSKIAHLELSVKRCQIGSDNYKLQVGDLVIRKCNASSFVCAWNAFGDRLSWTFCESLSRW